MVLMRILGKFVLNILDLLFTVKGVGYAPISTNYFSELLWFIIKICIIIKYQ